MTLTYHRFRPMRPAEEYLGQSGNEIGNLALDPMTLQLIAEAKTAGRRPSGIWIDGEYIRHDGVRFLSVRVNPPPESGRYPDPAWRKAMP